MGTGGGIEPSLQVFACQTPRKYLCFSQTQRTSPPLARYSPRKGSRRLNSNKNLAEQWFVYIVRCADGSLYTGIAKDVERRIEQHNAGTASRYTRSRLSVTLEYQEEQPNQSSALKRELAIKAMSRKAKKALIQSEK